MRLPKTGDARKLESFVLLYPVLRSGTTLDAMAKVLEDKDVALSNEEFASAKSGPDKRGYVSKLLKSLQLRYDAKLKKQDKNGHFTAGKDAEEFYRHAQRIVDAFGNLETHQEHVYISTIDIGAHFWIPQALANDGDDPVLEREINKDVSLHIQVREWWEVIQDVRKHIADFGLATEFEDDSLDHPVIITSDHKFVVSKDHPLVSMKKKFRLKFLEGETVVCMPAASGPVAIEYHLKSLNIRARIVTVDTASQVCSWISRGVAFGFLPDKMIPNDGPLAKLETTSNLIEAKDSLYRRYMIEKNKVSRTHEPLSLAAERIYEAIKTYWDARKAPNQ